MEKDILRQLKQDQRSYCTTMIDYNGLGSGFPGTPAPEYLADVQKVERIERAVKGNDFPTPEEINDAPDTAPSKRVIRIYAAYKKVIEGTIAAKAIGIEKMRSECGHFRNWLVQLENLPDI